jgi:hypothetical protein
MSQSKFAAITSSLLARKGEATPWEEPRKRLLSWGNDVAQPRPDQPSFIVPPEKPEPASPHLSQRFNNQPAPDCPKLADPDKMKKCAVRVSCHDYERLGILAVKSETTRHHLMQEALKQFLATETRPYDKDCLCLSRPECAASASTVGKATV